MEDCKNIEQAWNFLKLFTNIPNLFDDCFLYQQNNRKDLFSPYHYRKYIINKINDIYTDKQFYENEKNINIKESNLLANSKTKNIDINTQFKILDDIKYISSLGSCTNSYSHFNQLDKWYILQELGYIDIICMNLMIDEKLYYYYIKNPTEIKNYVPNLNLYYAMNYALPNVNPMFYNKNDKSLWINKINKMYYSGHDKNWYCLIKF